MLMILKQRKIKLKPGIEHKDYAFEVTILIITNIRKILRPCNPPTPTPSLCPPINGKIVCFGLHPAKIYPWNAIAFEIWASENEGQIKDARH